MIQPYGFQLNFYKNSCFFEVDTVMRSLVYSDKSCDKTSTPVTSTSEKVHKVLSVNDTTTNDFIVCVYGREWWVGKVVTKSLEQNDVMVSFMHPCGPRTTFHWSTPPDQCWLLLTSVLGKLSPSDWPMSTMGSRNFCTEKGVSDEAQAKFLQQ